jgi:hypothetical protein
VPDPQDTRFPTTHETLPCSAQNEQHPAIIAKRFSALTHLRHGQPKFAVMHKMLFT